MKKIGIMYESFKIVGCVKEGKYYYQIERIKTSKFECHWDRLLVLINILKFGRSQNMEC